jgi:D-alanine-D-alanine ligase-like ATP-grasp enzyme
VAEQLGSDREVRLTLIFEGQSAAYEVSLVSVRSVLRVVNPTRYDVLPSANQHYVAEPLRR